MAAKKKTAKKSSNGEVIVLPPPSASALALFEELFDPEMTAGAEGSSNLAPFISTEDGVMKVGPNVIGTELDAIILGVAVEHALYPTAYKKGKPSNPLCFYIGKSEKEAVPSDRSPQAQSPNCATCIKNAFGSAPNGTAKACRQSRRLLILPLGQGEDPMRAQLYRLRIPPTSIKYVTGYETLLKAQKRVFPSVVTHIHFEGHETNRFEVRFELERTIDDERMLRAIALRATEGKDSLFALPMVSADGGKQEPVKGGRRIVRR